MANKAKKYTKKYEVPNTRKAITVKISIKNYLRSHVQDKVVSKSTTIRDMSKVKRTQLKLLYGN